LTRIVILLSLILLNSKSEAQIIDNSIFSCSYDAKWEVINKNVLKEESINLTEKTGTLVEYVNGLRDKQEGIPYVLFQLDDIKFKGKKIDKIFRALSKTFGDKVYIDSIANSVNQKVESGKLFINSDKNYAYIINEMQIGTQPGKAISYIFIRQKGLLYMHCYSLDESFDKYFYEFENIRKSINIKNKYTENSTFNKLAKGVADRSLVAMCGKFTEEIFLLLFGIIVIALNKLRIIFNNKSS